MVRLSEYGADELAAMFPARKPENRKPEPVTPLPGWTEDGVERMLRDVYGLDEERPKGDRDV